MDLKISNRNNKKLKFFKNSMKLVLDQLEILNISNICQIYFKDVLTAVLVCIALLLTEKLMDKKIFFSSFLII